MHEHTDATNPPHGAGWIRLAEWGFGILGSLTTLLVPLAVTAVPASEVVAVIVEPGDRTSELFRIVAEADGSIVNAGGLDNVILARSDSGRFASRLYAAGARLVLDAGSASGCNPSAQRSASITTWTSAR